MGRFSVSRKLVANLSWHAFRVLGFAAYFRLLGSLLAALPTVLRTGRLRPVDARMGERPLILRYKGSWIRVDCPALDRQTAAIDDSFCFGLILEIFIRDCYLRHRREGLVGCRTVVDCGANRGLFSVIAASQAAVVVAVETQPQFLAAIHSTMSAAGCENYRVVQAFVGGDGALPIPRDIPVMTIDDIITQCDLRFIDLLKLDIEGSEFDLFRETDWLLRVGEVVMEVHPQYGDPAMIVEAFRSSGFRVSLSDANLSTVTDPGDASFMYARNATT